MRRRMIGMLAAAVAVVLFSACGGQGQKRVSEDADRLLEASHKAKDYHRMMALADSLEQAGSISPAMADYWRGYASDRRKQQDKAETFWRASLEKAEKSGNPKDMDAYVKSASRLANMLCVKGDLKGTLEMAVPAVKRLEEQQCDTTSDYVNLLIYIGCSQAGLGSAVDESDHGFYRAYKKHLENIGRKHSDESYKDAIAGLINIAYFCVQSKNYQDGLYYTRYFGELLGEYEQREGVSADYIDRQLGRYDIYKAQALFGLGRKEEAARVFEAFQATEYSRTPEGTILANGYLSLTEQ